MATQKLVSLFFLLLITHVLLILHLANVDHGLKLGFYQKTCPDAEAITRMITHQYFSRAPILAAPLLRMHFHDCFIRDHFGRFPRAKRWKIVSCLRDQRLATSFWQHNIAKANVCSQWFQRGHTIGTAHCSSFETRLYNFTGKGDKDPTLDPDYVVHLKRKCKPGDTTTLVEMDPGSFRRFDGDYYTLVAKRRGLFQSDSALMDDSETKSYVKHQANTCGSTFAKDFAESMVNMGKIGLLTSKAGEIRKHCAFVN